MYILLRNILPSLDSILKKRLKEEIGTSGQSLWSDKILEGIEHDIK